MDDIQNSPVEVRLDDTFKKLLPSHQREYIKWIEGAKKPETRAKRIQKMLDMLKRKAQ